MLPLTCPITSAEEIMFSGLRVRLSVCLFVCRITPKLMNGFPRIVLEGLGISKLVQACVTANKLFV